MKYPIKYIENNLVFNNERECFAYYELMSYNYSFLSNNEKLQVNENLKQLIAQYGDDKIHTLQIVQNSAENNDDINASKNQFTARF